MATFTKLPSGKWRVQVRKSGIYRSATFSTKGEAKTWAEVIEQQATHVAAIGFSQPPKEATVKDLIDKYVKMSVGRFGKTKSATLSMIIKRVGNVRLGSLNSMVMRDFVDSRIRDGAGGVTIAADLSYFSAVLKWARYSRRLDIPERLALDARESLKHIGLNTRSIERSREPTEAELERLYAYWADNPRQIINMATLVKFALATGMRQGEIARIRVEDIDRESRTILVRDRKDPKKKHGNNQVVPLFDEAWDILIPYISDRKSGSVFNVRSASVSTAFTRACQKLAIRDLRFHDLRHKATADFFRYGLEIPHVALMTGHKTWVMLKRYTEINAADVHNARSRLISA
ncbi:tyrosine-type recombinase/integrase [Stutzerimonas kirkiae]|uniref:tyrosine-type recombinase/integrase n=1 Tax=Stutzerimonas kirkiae TaxID=2211392 RepID=UPI0013F16028|nr:site-specific integrase [Stutzerimonas kirkiae]